MAWRETARPPLEETPVFSAGAVRLFAFVLSLSGPIFGTKFGSKNWSGNLLAPSTFNWTAEIPDSKLGPKNGLIFGTAVSAYGNQPSRDSGGNKRAASMQHYAGMEGSSPAKTNAPPAPPNPTGDSSSCTGEDLEDEITFGGKSGPWF